MDMGTGWAGVLLMTDEIIRIRGAAHVVTECGECGVVYTVPQVAYEHRRRDGGFNHCPNGHTWGWPKGTRQTEADILRRERDRLIQQAAQKDDEIREAREAARKALDQAAKAERATARVKKRVDNGVCPDCNRSFSDLHRHMQTKHKRVCEVVPIKVGAA